MRRAQQRAHSALTPPARAGGCRHWGDQHHQELQAPGLHDKCATPSLPPPGACLRRALAVSPVPELRAQPRCLQREHGVPATALGVSAYSCPARAQPSLVLKAVKNPEYRHYLDEAVAMEKSLNLPTIDPSRSPAPARACARQAQQQGSLVGQPVGRVPCLYLRQVGGLRAARCAGRIPTWPTSWLSTSAR